MLLNKKDFSFKKKIPNNKFYEEFFNLLDQTYINSGVKTEDQKKVFQLMKKVDLNLPKKSVLKYIKNYESEVFHLNHFDFKIIFLFLFKMSRRDYIFFQEYFLTSVFPFKIKYNFEILTIIIKYLELKNSNELKYDLSFRDFVFILNSIIENNDLVQEDNLNNIFKIFNLNRRKLNKKSFTENLFFIKSIKNLNIKLKTEYRSFLIFRRKFFIYKTFIKDYKKIKIHENLIIKSFMEVMLFLNYNEEFKILVDTFKNTNNFLYVSKYSIYKNNDILTAFIFYRMINELGFDKTYNFFIDLNNNSLSYSDYLFYIDFYKYNDSIIPIEILKQLF